MSDSGEPSYYEIALTHRQVLGVFVVLLVCVVIAFFAGVWVGQREEGPPPVEAAAAEPEDEPEEPAELGELEFFAEPSRPRPTPPPAAEPPAAEAAAAASAGGGASEPAAGGVLVVQVFSSADRDQAQRVVDRLRSAQLPALLSPVEVGERTMYRVRVGPYNERAEAEGVANRIRRDFKLDTWITQ